MTGNVKVGLFFVCVTNGQSAGRRDREAAEHVVGYGGPSGWTTLTWSYLVQKIRARYLAAPDKSPTLELLVENEKDEKKRTATEGLLWLIR